MTAPIPPGRTFTVKGQRGYQIDGNPVDMSVTTVLERGVPKNALVEWAAKASAAVVVNEWDLLAEMRPSERGEHVRTARFRESDPAKLRGTDLHTVLEESIVGRSTNVPLRLQSAAHAIIDLVDAWDLQPVLVEVPVVNFQYGYAGRVDLVADDRFGCRAIYDLKSGKDVYDDAALQLAAYRYADGYLDPDTDGQLLPMIPVEQARVIHVTTDSARIVPVDAGEATWRVFLHAQQTARWSWRTYQAWKARTPWPVGPELDISKQQRAVDA